MFLKELEKWRVEFKDRRLVKGVGKAKEKKC